MFSLYVGMILVVMTLILVWIFMASFFSKIGEKVLKVFKPFINQNTSEDKDNG